MATDTTSSGRSTGNDRNSTAFTRLKIAVFAPIPSASVITATEANPGRVIKLLRA
jgi:hypothetical protein